MMKMSMMMVIMIMVTVKVTVMMMGIIMLLVNGNKSIHSDDKDNIKFINCFSDKCF